MSALARLVTARPRLLVLIILLAAIVSLRIADKVISTGTPAPPATVGFVRSLNPSPISDSEVAQMIRQAVDLAEGPGVGLRNVIQPGRSVLIQPNLVNCGPGKFSGCGVITDVRVVKEVVAMCFEAGAGSVTIGEGTASLEGAQSPIRNQTWQEYYYAGYSTSISSKVFKYDSRVALVDFNDVGYTHSNWTTNTDYNYSSTYVTAVTVPNSLLRPKLYMPNPLMQADVVIKCPILKNHNLAGITGALKLAIGTAPCDIYHYPNMTVYKWALVHQPENRGGYTEVEANARTIVDLNKCRKPDFVVMDGLIGITNGPGGANTPDPQMRCIIAGKDPVAVDTIECLLEGYDPNQLPTLTHAATAGLGTRSIADITVKCDETQPNRHVADTRYNFPDYYGAGRRADETDPQMDGLTVSQNAKVSGTISVAPLNPRDYRNNICKAEVFVDGQYVGSAVGAPYAYSWNTTSVPDGRHTLKLYLYDDCLNETSLTRTVYVCNSSPLKAILDSQDNEPVHMGGLVTSIAGNDAQGWLYAQAPDRSGGIRVLVHSGSFPEGSLVEIAGTLASLAGERCIDSSIINESSTSGTLSPLALMNRSLGGGNYNQWTNGIYGATGLYNIGLLVRTWGKVTYVDTATPPAFFYIDDGSGLCDGSSHMGVRVLLRGFTAPTLGQKVNVTGISSIYQVNGQNQRVLVPRKASDIN